MLRRTGLDTTEPLTELNKEMSVPLPRSSRDLAHRMRHHVVDMTMRGKSSHVGSALSCVDIIAVLYSDVLRVYPDHPDATDRDRFILSKGHAGSAVYSALAECDFFPVSWLENHYADGSLMSGHVSHKGIPGVEVSTGSLGHGLPIAAGMALAAKLDRANWRSICLMSDGECDEGTTWEAAMLAAHLKLSNLTAIIDYNKLQSLGSTQETLGLEPFADKWASFGWHVSEVDGHDHDQIREVVQEFSGDQPHVIIAHTTKGKGISFMENSVLWHYRTPQGVEYEAAKAELGHAPAVTHESGSRR